MSEKYGKCFYCDGMGYTIVEKSHIDCLTCDGTGERSDALAYEQLCADTDWEKDRPDDLFWR